MTLHHKNGKNGCLLCDEKIIQGHICLQSWWKDVKENFPEAHLSWVWRGEEEQNFFFKVHKSRLLWPDSAHNFMKDGVPYSRAMDIFRLMPDGTASFNPDFCYKISEFLIMQKAPIIWGGSWTSFKDTPHFQLKKQIV